MIPNYNPMYMNMFNQPYNMPSNPSFNQNSNMAPALYVGDLDESITEEMLYTHFSKYGPIYFIKLARDPISKKSKGFAYVNFYNPRDAERARSLSLYEKLGNKAIRVMFRKNNIKDLHEGNLFVKNLDHKCTVKELHNHFSEVGNVLSAKIATDSKGESLGYGYVQFEKGEDAEKAMDALNNSKLKEREINISRFASLGERSPATKRNLYVKNLPATIPVDEMEKTLKKAFEAFGEIETLVIKKSDQEDKHFAFVCYKEQSDAQKAFDSFNASPQDPLGVGQNLYVAWHQSKVERHMEMKKKYSDMSQQTNLYIKNLKTTITEEKLTELFSEYGQITSIKVKDWNNPTGGSSSRFGFIDFKSQSDCQNALINGPKNNEIAKAFINNEPYIGLYQPREQRNKYLQVKNMFHPMTPFFMGSMPFNPMFGGGNQPPVQPNYRGGSGQQFYPGGYQGGNQFNPNNKFGQRPQGQFGGQQQYQKKPYNPKNRKFDGQQQHQPFHRTDNRNMASQEQPQVGGAGQKTELGGEFFSSYEKIKANLRDFLNLKQDQQRNILGNLLFPIIAKTQGPTVAPKITGMLIDLNVLEVNDVLEFFEDPVKLDERINEAKDILDQEGDDQE